MKKSLKCFLMLLPLFVVSVVCLAIFLPRTTKAESPAAVDTSSSTEASADISQGGAIYLDANTTYNMRGGVIKGHTAMQGGAIYVSNGAVLNIYGGLISDNNASQGASIYIEGGGEVNIKEGFIFDTIYVDLGGSLRINDAAYVLTTIFYDSDMPIIFTHEGSTSSNLVQQYFPQRSLNIELGEYCQGLCESEGSCDIIRCNGDYNYKDLLSQYVTISVDGHDADNYIISASDYGDLYVTTDESRALHITFSANYMGSFFAVPAFDMEDQDHFAKSIRYCYRKSENSLTLYGFHDPVITYYMDENNIIHLRDGMAGQELWRVGVKCTIVEKLLWFQTGDNGHLGYADYNSFGEEMDDDLLGYIPFEVGKVYYASSGDTIKAVHKPTDEELEFQYISNIWIDFNLKYGLIGPTRADYECLADGDKDNVLWGQRGWTIGDYSDCENPRFYNTPLRDVLDNKVFTYRFNEANGLFEFAGPGATEADFENPENIWITLDPTRCYYTQGHMVVRITDMDSNDVLSISASKTIKTVMLPDRLHIKIELLPLDERGNFYFPDGSMENIVDKTAEDYNRWYGQVSRARTNVTVLTYKDRELTRKEKMMVLWLWYCKNWGEAGYDTFYKIVQGYNRSYLTGEDEGNQFFEKYIQAEFDMLCNCKTYYDPIYAYWRECRPEIDLNGTIEPAPQINILAIGDEGLDYFTFLNSARGDGTNEDALSYLMSNALWQVSGMFEFRPYYLDFDFIFGPDITATSPSESDMAWNRLFNDLCNEYGAKTPMAYDDILLPLSYGEGHFPEIEYELFVVTNVPLLTEPTDRLSLEEIEWLINWNEENAGMIYPFGEYYDSTYRGLISAFHLSEGNCADANGQVLYQDIIDRFGRHLSAVYNQRYTDNFLFIAPSEVIGQLFQASTGSLEVWDQTDFSTIHIYALSRLLDWSDEMTISTFSEMRYKVPTYQRIFALNHSVGGNWDGQMSTLPELMARIIYDLGYYDYIYTGNIDLQLCFRRNAIIEAVVGACAESSGLCDVALKCLEQGHDFLDIVV